MDMVCMDIETKIIFSTALDISAYLHGSVEVR
jgi:hypothetical protein